MKLLFAFILLGLISSGCSTLSASQDRVVRESYTVMRNGSFSVSIQTTRRTSKTLLQSRLLREISQICPENTILNKEYSLTEDFREMTINFTCGG